MATDRWPRLEPAESWRGRSIAERNRAIQAACRTAMQILDGVPDRRARLARIDPVPASTHVLLRRLAAQHRHG
jgi:hypothetical protein